MMFSDLTGRELAIVEKMGSLKSFTMNTPIIREGEAGDAFYLIIAGHVEVRKALKNKRYRTLIKLGPAEMFGELCFLGQEKRSASVVVTEDCHVLEFRQEGFARLLKVHPEIAAKIYEAMARELAQRLVRCDEALRDALIWSLGTKAGIESFEAGGPQAEG